MQTREPQTAVVALTTLEPDPVIVHRTGVWAIEHEPEERHLIYWWTRRGATALSCIGAMMASAGRNSSRMSRLRVQRPWPTSWPFKKSLR
jgi:hypothetical protein